MKPISIFLKNYKSYGDEGTLISLEERNVKLLLGVNGSGKSSIVDSIIWCLTGRSLCSVDEVVNRKNKSNCEVEFIFKIQKNTYSISRYRNHELHANKILLYKNGKNISSLKQTETQNLIYSIIDVNYDTIVSSIILSSETYSSFLRSTISERLKTFDGILSMKIVNRWLETAKKLRKPISEKIEQLYEKKNRMEVGIETLTKNIEDYEDKVKDILLKLKEDKIQKKEHLQKTEKILNKLKKIDFVEELKKNEEYYKVIKNNADIDIKIKAEEERKQNNKNLLEELYSLKNKKEEYEKIDYVKELENIKNYSIIKQNNSTLENKILTLKGNLKDPSFKEERIAEIEELIKVNEKRFKTLNVKSVCYTCGKELNEEENKKLLEETRKKEKDLKEELVLNNLNLSTIIKDNELITAEIKDLKNALQELPIKSKYKEDFLNNIKDEINSIEKKISLLKAEIIQKDNSNKEIDERIKDLKAEKIQDDLENPMYTKEFLENIKDEIKKEKKNYEEIKNKLVVIEEKAKSSYDKNFVTDIKSKIKKLKDGKKTEEEKIKKVMVEDNHYSYLITLLSNKNQGFKKFLIGRMIDPFNVEINKYVPLFFDYEVEVSFDKNLTETIKVEGEKVSFKTFSLGEKTRLEIAISFSLFMLGKMFFSSSINFMVFDEILDGKLDKEGLSRVINIVDNFSKNNSIIVISHDERMKDYLHNHIKVNKDEYGFSKIQQ